MQTPSLANIDKQFGSNIFALVKTRHSNLVYQSIGQELRWNPVDTRLDEYLWKESDIKKLIMYRKYVAQSAFYCLSLSSIVKALDNKNEVRVT